MAALDTLPTPSVLVDRKRMRANVARMQAA